MACQEESHTRLNGGAHAVAGGFSAHLRAKSALRRWLSQSQRAAACAAAACIQRRRRRFNKTCSLASGMYFVSKVEGWPMGWLAALIRRALCHIYGCQAAVSDRREDGGVWDRENGIFRSDRTYVHDEIMCVRCGATGERHLIRDIRRGGLEGLDDEI